ncbi:NAD(P)-binding protein [Penicillium sp. IBT 18751x]|nr:NAD(P)-binding protein [Penicillium sp. IBT 18751x]
MSLHEVNVKISYLMGRAFLWMVGSEREATIVNVNIWGMFYVEPTGSSYFISRLALGRLSEAIVLAYPNVFLVNYYPGMIKTEMADRPEVVHFREDTVELAAGTAVYLASPQARFLSGNDMSTNWDVNG